MRCIALLSGGKDSVAAIEVARGHGWAVEHALRVVPEADDAYMFHTPNLELVPDVGRCMDLHVDTVQARADPRQEVDDLEAGLARAKEAYGIEAVLSGALASEYQRTRIDRIGHRLGLHTFAPLWHKDPETYMASLAGYDIRFARVAADGLPNDWAGQRLDAARIKELRSKRLHIAGEGGEYETLVLDAPHYTSRIEVRDAEVQASASRATWHVRQWDVVPK